MECVRDFDATVLHLYDGPPVRVRAAVPEEVDVRVNNPRQRTIHLAATDGCLYGPAHAQRCDCVLICDEEAHFIEFKHGLTKNRTERVKECIPQLAETIVDFHRRGIIADGSTVRAIACVGFTEQWPPRGASLEARVVQLNRLTPDTVLVELSVSNQTSF
ncbi:MAG: hypothetical protein H7330_15175 [Hymenobacteraceae bacterium]|nr:hypothetical protein [Hymenobacteraceae bacterium]